MSLLSTSSTTQQEAYLYENHYPQPIVISPNSQICLQKFIHYRGSNYEVTTQNNTIGFRLGTGGGNQDVSRFASIPVGTYDGADLADAITTSLNSVNQQQNYEWTCSFTPAPSTGDVDIFQIQYESVPTPDPNSGTYNIFSSGQLALSGQAEDNKLAKITYNGTNANHFANVISKRSTLVYLGSQLFNEIQPSHHTEIFQPLQVGLVRNNLSDPNNPNPNLQFTPQRYDIAFECEGNGMAITYGRQRPGNIPIGSENWFVSDVRRDLGALFDPIFKANAGVFSPHTKIQVLMTIYASSQTSRRVLIQMFKKDVNDSTYSPLADGLGGNSPITGTPLVKTLLVGGDTFPGLVFDSNDPTLNDTSTKINQHYPKLSVAPFYPTVSFQKTGNLIITGYDLDLDTWTNNAGVVTTTFEALTDNANGYVWKTTTNVGNILDNLYWYQIDPLTYQCMAGDVPLTNPPDYVAALNPTNGNVNPNGQIALVDSGAILVQTINFDGASPVPQETGRLSIFTQGIFNGIEPVAGVTGVADEVTAGSEGGGQLQDLSSNARLFLRGSGGGAVADVANLLGFSNNEEDFGGGSQTGASATSDQEPQQTANNNTLHISIPEMPLVKSYEGENSAEAKSIAIIPREEFATGDQEGSLVYVAPFENWIDINNGQELNMNLITTLVRNADGSLAENLERETQAVFKIRQDPMKLEEERKADKFRELAEMMANTLNTGLTALIKPNQLIGS